MGRITKRSLVILGIGFLSTGVFANNGDESKKGAKAESAIRTNVQWAAGTETLDLVVENPGGKKFYVELTDPDGNILLKSNYKAWETRIETKYQFEGADEGCYRLEIGDGIKTVVKKINLKHVQTTETVVNIQ